MSRPLPRWCAPAITALVIAQGGCAKEGGAADTPPKDCAETTVYEDVDGDGFGEFSKRATRCIEANKPGVGFALKGGDCKPEDVLAYPGAQGVCSDGVDDSCSGQDDPCPETQPATGAASPPRWDCAPGSTPPGSVYAWARFDQGKGFYPDGACFYIFEGTKDVFYLTSHKMTPLKTDCATADEYGCTCPVSVPGADASDQRLYAYTLSGSPQDCPKISLKGAASEYELGADGQVRHKQQPLSNACRRYAASLFKSADDPSGALPASSYFATGLEQVDLRLSNFPTLEIACAEAPDCEGADWSSLLKADFRFHQGFEKK